MGRERWVPRRIPTATPRRPRTSPVFVTAGVLTLGVGPTLMSWAGALPGALVLLPGLGLLLLLACLDRARPSDASVAGRVPSSYGPQDATGRSRSRVRSSSDRTVG
ncbi:hypothetical protein JOD66_003691 [Nocardioides nitrophenolicus]|nr:hypothetical protein [Nocardioides nitrophenolicus]